MELYHNNIVETLHSSITGHDSQALWPNVIRIILYQVNCGDIEFTEKEMEMVIDLLNIMCHEDTADEIIGKAAVVLAYLSLTLEDVSTVAHLLSSLLDLSDNEVVEESVRSSFTTFLHRQGRGSAAEQRQLHPYDDKAHEERRGT